MRMRLPSTTLFHWPVALLALAVMGAASGMSHSVLRGQVPGDCDYFPPCGERGCGMGSASCDVQSTSEIEAGGACCNGTEVIIEPDVCCGGWYCGENAICQMSCGNGICEDPEDSTSCPEDCGYLSGDICGDGICQVSEYGGGCEEDCNCGGGIPACSPQACVSTGHCGEGSQCCLNGST